MKSIRLYSISTLTPPLHNFNMDLSRVYLWWTKADKFDHSFSYDPSSLETIVVDEWYGLVPFSSVIFVHKTPCSNYYTSSFSPQQTWPVYCFYIILFYQNWQLASTKDENIYTNHVYLLNIYFEHFITKNKIVQFAISLVHHDIL